MTTTVAEPTPLAETQVEQGSSYRWCEGCPRCQDSNAGFCKQGHANLSYAKRFWPLHPVCRRCGHCVLRGSHADDISDLEV